MPADLGEVIALHRAVTYRLYPTRAQEEILTQFVGACRYVYNLALEQRETWSRRHPITFASQCRETTLLRAEAEWLRAVPADFLHQAVQDLDRAFKGFFAGRAGYPTARRRGRNDSFRHKRPLEKDIRRVGPGSGTLCIPKLGWIKFRGWRDLPGRVRHLTVARRRSRWFVSITCEREAPLPAASTLPAVGIDLGVAAFASLSDGTRIEPKNYGKRAAASIRRAQRALARKKRGSANRAKAASRLQRLQARVANARRDFLHKTSTAIAKSHGMVAVEALQVRAMTASAGGSVDTPGRRVAQKAGLNRSILDQGWTIFRSMLAYKMAERGGALLEVNPANTSITCSACGVVDANSRKSQAAFVCLSCGHSANADTNAAINILRRAGCASTPVEVSRNSGPMKQEGATPSQAETLSAPILENAND